MRTEIDRSPKDQISEAFELTATLDETTRTKHAAGQERSLANGASVHIYRIELEEGERLKVLRDRLHVPKGSPYGTEFVFRMFDASGTQLARGVNHVGMVAASSGVYYLGVSDITNRDYDAVTGRRDNLESYFRFEGLRRSDYRFDLTVTPPPGRGDAFETLADAHSLGVVTARTTLSGSINSHAQSDLAESESDVLGHIQRRAEVQLWSVDAEAGQKLEIDIDLLEAEEPSKDQLFDPLLRLFDAEGQELAVNNNRPGRHEIRGTEAAIYFTVPVDGRYYVGVSDASNRSYDAVSGHDDIRSYRDVEAGQYALHVRNTTKVGPLASDSDHSRHDPIPLPDSPNETWILDGLIKDSGDRDVYSLANTGDSATVEVRIEAFDSLDPAVRFFTPAGREIGPADEHRRYTVEQLDELGLHFRVSRGLLLSISAKSFQYEKIHSTQQFEGTRRAGERGDYRITVIGLSRSTFDIDGRPTQSNPLGVLAAGNRLEARQLITADDDVDFFSFYVEKGEQFDVDIDSDDRRNLHITLFDEAGVVRLRNDTGRGIGDSATTQDPAFRTTANSSGVHFIAVTTSSNRGFEPFGFSEEAARENVASYSLIVQSVAETDSGEPDADDQIREAKNLKGRQTGVLFGPQSGRIDSLTDVDMFRFEVDTAGYYGFGFRHVAGSRLAPIIRIFQQSNGQFIEVDSGSFVPLEEDNFAVIAEIEADSPAVYYVGISGGLNFNYDPVTGRHDNGDDNFDSPGEYELYWSRQGPENSSQ